MGFWDRNVQNSFDSLFDMNRGGVLDPVEQEFQLDFLTRQMEEDDHSDDDEDELDLDELEYMDEDERREALEEAGYDPDDFDDDFINRHDGGKEIMAYSRAKTNPSLKVRT